jgi:hypothetical protein
MTNVLFREAIAWCETGRAEVQLAVITASCWTEGEPFRGDGPPETPGGSLPVNHLRGPDGGPTFLEALLFTIMRAAWNIDYF